MTDLPTSVRLSNLPVNAFLDTVASDNPAPGGGSVVALAGALGAALVAMVARLTAGRERYAAYDAEMRTLLRQADALRQDLADLVDADSTAYTAVTAAYQLPKGSEELKAQRTAAIQVALRRAVEMPLAVAAACVAVLQLAGQAAGHGNRNAASDAAVAALMAYAGLQGAGRNVRVNLRTIRDEAFCREAEQRVAELLVEGQKGLAAALQAADSGA
jgi:formiminotetrahydrofolate cyclodeaminase